MPDLLFWCSCVLFGWIPQGLQLTSRQLVGVDSGIGSIKPAELGGKTVNQAIIEGYAGELTPEAAGMMNILHFVQVRGRAGMRMQLPTSSCHTGLV